MDLEQGRLFSDLLEQTSCPICYDDYATNQSKVENRPRVLNCSHSLCTGCLRMIENSGLIRCPTCKKITYATVDQLPFNRSLESMIDSITTIQRARSQQNLASAPPEEGSEEDGVVAGSSSSHATIQFTPLCFECEEANIINPATHTCKQCSGAFFCEQCYFRVHHKYSIESHKRLRIDTEMSDVRGPLLPSRTFAKRKTKYQRRKKFYACRKYVLSTSMLILILKIIVLALLATISAFLCTTAIFVGRVIFATRGYDLSVERLLVWSLQMYPATKWLSASSLDHPVELGMIVWTNAVNWVNLYYKDKAWILFTGSIIPLAFSLSSLLLFLYSVPKWYISKVLYVVCVLWCLDPLLRMLPTLGIPILVIYGPHTASVFTTPLYYCLYALGVNRWYIQLGTFYSVGLILNLLSLKIWMMMLREDWVIAGWLQNQLVKIRAGDRFVNRVVVSGASSRPPTHSERIGRMKWFGFYVHIVGFSVWCAVVFMVAAWTNPPTCFQDDCFPWD